MLALDSCLCGQMNERQVLFMQLTRLPCMRACVG